MPHILIQNIFFAPYSYGGATVLAEQIARRLVDDHGLQVSAISAQRRGDLAPYSVTRTHMHGIDNFLINLPTGTRSYEELYDDPKITDVLDGLFDVLAPDLLHAHCLQDIGVGGLDVAHARGVPSILSVHDFWWLCERQFMIRPDQSYCGQDPVDLKVCASCVPDITRARLRAARLKQAAAQATFTTYPSRFARDLSLRSGFGEQATALVWENGVQLPTRAFWEAQAARRAADPRLTFGFVGGPSQIKGWPLVRSCFQSLDQENFKGLVVEGSLTGDWWSGHNLSTLKGDWAVHPRYDATTMDAFYAKIDVLLFPSQWKETYGLTVREALARGIAVIQTDSGGTTEHTQFDPSRSLAIGDGPEALRALVEEALETGPQTRAPVPVHSVEEQAARFTELLAQVWQKT